jgi:hypothetical protein
MTDFDENLQQVQIEMEPREAQRQLTGRQSVLETLKKCLNG